MEPDHSGNNEPADMFVANRKHLEVQAQDAHNDSLTDLDELLSVRRMAEIAVDVLDKMQVESGRIDLFYIDETEIAELNELHMGKKGPTDVLSFPMDQPVLAQDHALVIEPVDVAGPPLHLGDLVISPVVALRQCGEHAGTPLAELVLLTIHGVLHILGHDHAQAEETMRMQALERRFMSDLGLTHPVSL